MNRSTFMTIKYILYMNGSVFSNAMYMNMVGFEILAHTPVTQLPTSYPPPSQHTHTPHPLPTPARLTQVKDTIIKPEIHCYLFLRTAYTLNWAGVPARWDKSGKIKTNWNREKWLKMHSVSVLNRRKWKRINLVGRLSLSVGWENGPERGLKTVSFNP